MKTQQQNSDFEKEFEEIDEEAKKKAKFRPISVGDLIDTKFPESEWVVENLVPKRGITIISGHAGSFKTWLALQIAVSISKDENIFGNFSCATFPVLIVDEENNPRELHKRFIILGAKREMPIFILSQKCFNINDKDSLNAVLEICRAMDIGLVIFDSFVRIHSSDENNANEMSKVFLKIKEFNKIGVSVVVLHHERKEFGGARSRMRGSSDIYAAVDCHLSLVRDKDCPGKVKVEQSKLRCAKELEPFELMLDENSGLQYFGEIKSENKFETVSREVRTVLSDKEKMLKKEIIEKIKDKSGLGEKFINKTLCHMINQGEVKEEKGGKNAKFCSLTEKKHSKKIQEEIFQNDKREEI